MYIIVGGTGRVGCATARALLRRGEPVTVVTRDANHASALKDAGAKIVETDVRDVNGLRKAFRGGRRAFLINPPADPSKNTDAEERATAAAMLKALEGSGLEKVVAASTYGARPGEPCGDLTVLHELEERLLAQPIPAAINRGAYYMSNWADALSAVRNKGSLPSFFPADLIIPMVAPADLGEAAAQRLTEPASDVELHYVEGPERYTPQDVADAFGAALDMNVAVDVIPPEAWEDTYVKLGFSEAAAKTYACMTGTVVDGGTAMPKNPVRGSTTLQGYIRALVRATHSSQLHV